MFTGLIEGTGKVLEAAPHRLRLASHLALAVGDSLAVNGCCLTLVPNASDSLAFDVCDETKARTTLGELQPGNLVNLERALLVGARFGGHMVSGHIDCVGTVVSVEKQADFQVIWVQTPPSPYVVEKGSIAIHGVSLTVHQLVQVSEEKMGLRLDLIPQTLQVTNLAGLTPGSRVNIEWDLLAKYVNQLVSPYRC